MSRLINRLGEINAIYTHPVTPRLRAGTVMSLAGGRPCMNMQGVAKKDTTLGLGVLREKAHPRGSLMLPQP